MSFLLAYAFIGLLVWIAAVICHGDDFVSQIQALAEMDEDVGEISEIEAQAILLISLLLFWPAFVAMFMRH